MFLRKACETRSYSVRNACIGSDFPMTDKQETSALLQRAADLAQNYLESIPGRSVTPSATALATLQKLHEPFPESSCDAGQVLEILSELGSPATVANAG